MNEIKAKILSSRFVNSGLIGKCKDWVYTKFISGQLEAQTDPYRAEILKDFYEIFGKDGWILAFGSFLRYYRDQTMDGQDVDILMRFDTFEKGKKQLQERGYTLFGVFTDCHERITEFKLLYKKAELDVFFILEEEGLYYYAGTYENSNNKDKVIREVIAKERIVRGEGYCSFIKQIPDLQCAEYEFNGMKFVSYKNVDLHMSCEYGDWRTPDPHFDCTASIEGNPTRVVPNAKVVYYYKEPLKIY